MTLANERTALITQLVQERIEGRIKEKDYLKEVSAIDDRFLDRISRFANILRIVDAMKIEESIDFTKVDAERMAVIRELHSVAEKEQIRKLELAALQFKLGKSLPSAFHSVLIGLADFYQVDAASLNVRAYTTYVQIWESIDLTAVQEELRRLDAELISSL